MGKKGTGKKGTEKRGQIYFLSAIKKPGGTELNSVPPGFVYGTNSYSFPRSSSRQATSRGIINS
jgi:hypothetical protein